MTKDELIKLVEEIAHLRANLAAAEARLDAVLSRSGGARGPVRATARQTQPVTQRVARLLATRGPLPFAEVVAGVQPATKFAVKSALNKGRQRREFRFAGGKYALAEPRTQKSRQDQTAQAANGNAR